jgi:hypothetical protein
MKKLTTLMVGALALAATSLSSAHATTRDPERVNYALKGAALALLWMESCHVADAPDAAEMDMAVIEMAERASRTAWVDPTDYPEGEWLRMVFSYIASKPDYAAVFNHDPAMVASLCNTIRERALREMRKPAAEANPAAPQNAPNQLVPPPPGLK